MVGVANRVVYLSSPSSRLVFKECHTSILRQSMFVTLLCQCCFLAHFATVNCFSALDLCPTSEEGQCRGELEGSFVEICASGVWQPIPKGSYTCSSGEMIPSRIPTLEAQPSGIIDPSVSQTTCSTAFDTEKSATDSSLYPSSGSGTTGHAVCSDSSVSIYEDDLVRASYTPGGTMASVYFASKNDTFRCELEPPDDELYVAVWTRYDPSLIAQPKPKNCGEVLHLKNPKTGASSDAVVLDRCQSCVGVDHQVSDPTTPDSLVNGATIDLSLNLWKKLYGEAEGSVYDVIYNGPIYGGSDSGDPDELVNPFCELNLENVAGALGPGR